MWWLMLTRLAAFFFGATGSAAAPLAAQLKCLFSVRPFLPWLLLVGSRRTALYDAPRNRRFMSARGTVLPIPGTYHSSQYHSLHVFCESSPQHRLGLNSIMRRDRKRGLIFVSALEVVTPEWGIFLCGWRCVWVLCAEMPGIRWLHTFAVGPVILQAATQANDRSSADFVFFAKMPACLCYVFTCVCFDFLGDQEGRVEVPRGAPVGRRQTNHGHDRRQPDVSVAFDTCSLQLRPIRVHENSIPSSALYGMQINGPVFHALRRGAGA